MLTTLRLRIPKTLLWVLNLTAVYAVLFTLFRCLTLFLFRPAAEPMANLLPTFWLGLRFDLRWIGIVLFPVLLGGLHPRYSPFASDGNKKFWTGYLAAASFFIIFFFVADFTAFSYNRTRLGASALNFAEDFRISSRMIWQSYPIVWILAGLTIVAFLLVLLFSKWHRRVSEKPLHRDASHRSGSLWLMLALFGWMIWGGFPGPLRWNAAFRLKDDFCGFLALNPLQTFFSTLGNRQPQFDEGKAKDLYPVLSDWMGWDQKATTYKKEASPRSSYFTAKPNVVLVVCESFSMYKSSMSGNRLNTTPYFKSLCDSGLFFSRCFTPHFSTARGLFATVTGIPDVQLAKFSTRTEAALNQHTIINNFEGYDKFYFLGGSPAFNNFEGLMQNVSGVQMMTEGAFTSKPIDVWGISDKNLFLEADKLFAQQRQPFFAVIQTSDNHPPYSIAEEDKDFVRKEPSREELEKWGFESAAQYNALRYFDYSVRKFVESARKQPYFNNTLFVFVGDHGIAGNATAIYPKQWTDDRLTEMHVPLLFFAPGHLPATLRNEVVSQIDVLPTIASIAGQKYVNTTLGRDVISPQKNHSAFFIRHDEGEIGLITERFYFTKNVWFQKEKLQLLDSTAIYSAPQLDSIKRGLSNVATGYLETARWMLMNNKHPLSH